VPLTAPEGAAAWNLRVLAHALAGEWEDAFAACGEDALWRWLLHRWQGSEPENLSVPTEWLTSLRENFRELLALLLQLREFERYEQALPLLERLVPDERERAELLGDLYGQFGFWEMALEMLLPFAQDGGLTRDGLADAGESLPAQRLLRRSHRHLAAVGGKRRRERRSPRRLPLLGRLLHRRRQKPTSPASLGARESTEVEGQHRSPKGQHVQPSLPVAHSPT